MQEVWARIRADNREDISEAVRHLKIPTSDSAVIWGGASVGGGGRAGERGVGEVVFLLSNCYRLLLVLR